MLGSIPVVWSTDLDTSASSLFEYVPVNRCCILNLIVTWYYKVRTMNNHYIQNSGDKYIPKELETAFQLNSGDKHISKELATAFQSPYP